MPHAMQLGRLEHVGEERGVHKAQLLGGKKLRQHRDVVHAGHHDPGIG